MARMETPPKAKKLSPAPTRIVSTMVRGQDEQLRPHWCFGGQVERVAGDRRHLPGQLGLRGGRDRHRGAGPGQDLAPAGGHSLDVGEQGARTFVARHHVTERGLRRHTVELSAQSQPSLR
jgi:hypothetical protein